MNPTDRPPFQLVPSRLDRTLNVVSLAGVLLIIALLGAVWSRLPLRVPTHFGLLGKPDDWGAPAALLLYPILAVVAYVLLTLLARVPWIYNYPVALTEDNAQRLYTLGRNSMLWLRTEIVWMQVILGGQTIRVALGQAHGLGPVAVLWLGVIGGTMIYYVTAMLRERGQ
jgi:hypothetical protein